MTTEPPSPDFKAIWRDQPTENLTMSVADIRAKAQRFELRGRVILTINYVTAAAIVFLFGLDVANTPNGIIKLGSAFGVLFWPCLRRVGPQPSARKDARGGKLGESDSRFSPA